MGKNLFRYSLGIVCLILFSCGNKTNEQNIQDIKTVKIDTVKSASEMSILQFPAKVKASQDINIAFRVSGTINKIHVNEGDKISKGQLLASLDPTDYKLQLQATEAEYQQIKSEAERIMALYNENGTTPVINDKAKYGLQQIEAKYQNHKDQLSYTRIYAPFNGYVQKKLFSEHETVGAGMPVISIIGKGSPELELNIPASEYIRRNDFERYTCTFDIFPNKVYTLSPISINEKANSNQLFSMRLKFDGNTNPMPSPGMNTLVSIYTRANDKSSFSIPSSAIIQIDNNEYVYIFNANSDNCVQLAKIKCLQLKHDGTALINSNELKIGDCIVTSGVHRIKNGEKVNILKPASATNVGGLL